MPKTFRYSLTETGKSRCKNKEFYLQESSPLYKGLTESVFYLMYEKDIPMSVREIADELELSLGDKNSLSPILYYAYKAGYMERERI